MIQSLVNFLRYTVPANVTNLLCIDDTRFVEINDAFFKSVILIHYAIVIAKCNLK